MSWYRLSFKKVLNSSAIWLVVFICTSNLHAHPHNWIDLQSSFILNNEGQLVQIKQRWEFDVYYSMITYEDVINEHGSEEKGLREAANRMVQNLASYSYFSSLKLGGVSTNLNTPSAYKLVTVKKDDQIALILEMVFDIEPGAVIENKELQWQVYDPTYYIAMNHREKNNIQIIGSESVCAIQLDIPNPSDDLIEYALSLDRNQKNTDGLGIYFAEKATINC